MSSLLLKYKNKYLASRNWILLPACKTQGIWFISTTHKWMPHNQINWKTAILQVFSIFPYTSFRRAEIAEWCSSSSRCAVILIRGSSPDPDEDLVIDLWWSRNGLSDQCSVARRCTCRRVFVQNSSEVSKWILLIIPTHFPWAWLAEWIWCVQQIFFSGRNRTVTFTPKVYLLHSKTNQGRRVLNHVYGKHHPQYKPGNSSSIAVNLI